MHRFCLAALVSLATVHLAAGTTYEVGPGKALAKIGDVAWESLAAGDTVLIYAKPNQEPYREKWVISRAGTALAPITVRGVPDSAGNRPVISGENATTRLQLSYTNGIRGLLKIGTANPNVLPQHIIIENLDLTSARPPYSFTDDAGNTQSYSTNAASLYIERGQNITIRNCILRDSGNGLFIGIFDGDTRDILVEGNYVHSNGIEGSAFEHNTYTAAVGITFQYNRYGPLRANCLGNNLKDRSVAQVVRYNWIEAGNRQLDLVEADDDPAQINDPRYNSTFVYGNVLIEPDSGNSQIVHYGGDNGNTALYRKGTLYFFNNTIVSTRSGNTTLLRLSTNSETADVRNNIIYVTQTGNRLGIVDDTGVAVLSNNWLKTGFVKSHGNATANVTTANPNVLGSEPGFVDFATQNFKLLEISACRDAGTVLNAAASAHPLAREYVKHLSSQARAIDATVDIGAFEFSLIQAPTAPTNLIAASISDTRIDLAWNDASSDETGFEIERSPDGVANWMPLTTRPADSTAHSDTGLTASTAYFYRMRATNAAGASAYSNIASATTQKTNPGGNGGGGSTDPNDPDGDGLANDLDADDDNDGFSDTQELAAGTDPLNPNSIPNDAKVAMTLSKLQGSVSFTATGKDSLSIAGVLPNLPSLFDPTGLAMAFNIGGATRGITLDRKGRGKSADGSVQLKLKPSVRNKTTKKIEFLGGPVAFKASLKKGSWVAQWTDEGIDSGADAKNSTVPMTVDVTLSGVIYTETVTSLYSGKSGKSGRFKFSRKLPK